MNNLLIENKIINYNKDNLSILDINNKIKRVKLIVENSNNEIILCCSNKNYFFLGGHAENDETDVECLEREIKEESGVSINLNLNNPFFIINYYKKNYPKNEINTLITANYYMINYDLNPNIKKVNLTDEEIQGGFKIIKFKKNIILKRLNESLKYSTKKQVTIDTIHVLEEYLKKN